MLARACDEENPEYRAVDTLLKGVEAPLPGKIPFFDKDGHKQTAIRVRWWLKPDAERTVADTVFPPDPILPNTLFTT
jgi:hypothetical protein